MYTELELIEGIKDKRAKVSVLLDFIEEYSGWIQHLKEVGSNWGVGGEEVGAAKELFKVVQHVKLLKAKVIELTAPE